MSLHESIPNINLEPTVSDTLSPDALYDYFRLANWLYFSPQSIKSIVPGTPLHIDFSSLFTELWNGTQRVWLIIQSEQFRLLYMCSVLSLLIVTIVGPLCILGLFGYEFLKEIAIGTIFGTTLALLLIFVAGLMLSVSELEFPVHSAIAAIIYGTAIGLIVEIGILAAHNANSYNVIYMIRAAVFVGLLGGSSYSIISTWYIDGKNYLVVGVGIGGIVGLLCGAGVMMILVDEAVTNTYIWQQLSLCMSVGFMSFLVAALRCDDWLMSVLTIAGLSAKNLPRRIPRVTVLPMPYLKFHLENWLELHWEDGLHNANQFWLYTRQQYTVASCVKQILVEAADDELVQKVAYFADHQAAYHWDILQHKGNFWKHLLQYLLGKILHSSQAGRVQSTLSRQQRKVASALYRKQQRQLLRAAEENQTSNEVKLPLQTPVQATIAGFYFLTTNQFEQAQIAFEKAPTTQYGKEMCRIAEAFQILYNQENLLNSPTVKFPSRPRESKRPKTWEIVEEIQDLMRYLWLEQQCCRDQNKQTVTLTVQYRFASLSNRQRLTRLEQSLVLPLLPRWQNEIFTWNQRRPPRQPMKPFTVPFIFARPVQEANLHVGRENEMQRLKEAWLMSNRRPTVVHGLPLTGKTSLVLNTAKANAKALFLAWLDAKHIAGHINSELLLLSEMVTAIANATVGAGVQKAALATDPYPICETYIREICSKFYSKQLVIAIDGFEIFFEQIHTSVQQRNLLDFLWHLHQSISNLNLTFIMRRSPERLLLNNRHTFARITHTIPTPYFDWKTTYQLLQRPPTEYKPQFTARAIYRIYRETGGQPYLIQLIGYLIAQNFNQSLPSSTQDPLFTHDHLHSVMSSASFIQLQHNYFNELSEFLTQEDPIYTEILGAIARYTTRIRATSRQAVWMPEARISGSVNTGDGTRVNQSLLLLQAWNIVASKREFIQSQSNTRDLWSIKSDLFQAWIDLFI